jgi:hypothetical protein
MQETRQNTDPDARRVPDKWPAAIEGKTDERDETIRLLNEALSDALDEIERLTPARAA